MLFLGLPPFASSRSLESTSPPSRSPTHTRIFRLPATTATASSPPRVLHLSSFSLRRCRLASPHRFPLFFFLRPSRIIPSLPPPISFVSFKGVRAGTSDFSPEEKCCCKVLLSFCNNKNRFLPPPFPLPETHFRVVESFRSCSPGWLKPFLLTDGPILCPCAGRPIFTLQRSQCPLCLFNKPRGGSEDFPFPTLLQTFPSIAIKFFGRKIAKPQPFAFFLFFSPQKGRN